MMEENFRRIADAVRLPEGSRARIRTQIASHRKEQEASTVKQPKKHLPRLAVAAIIIAAALTLTAAAAAVIHQSGTTSSFRISARSRSRRATRRRP